VANSEPATANAMPVPAIRIIAAAFVVAVAAAAPVFELSVVESLAALKTSAEPEAVCVEVPNV